MTNRDEIPPRHWVEIPFDEGKALLAAPGDSLGRIGLTMADLNALKRDDIALANNNGWAWSEMDRTVFGWNPLSGVLVYRRDHGAWEPVEPDPDCKVVPSVPHGRWGAIQGAGLFVLVGGEKAYLYRYRAVQTNAPRRRNRR